MPGELSIQSILSRDTVPVLSVPQLVYSLLELRPAEVTSGGPLPLNLCLVLDQSGSMSGSKIESLRDATRVVLDMLQPQDYISVISFSSRFEVLFPSQQIGDAARRDSLKARIAQLKSGGGTNMAPAMEAGLAELRRNMGGSQAQVNRLVLLTDGITEKEKRCLEQVDQARQLGIPITALGIGKDWNDKLMQDIGARTGGVADYIATPDQIRTHFAQAVQQMQAVALQNGLLRVKPALGIEVRAVFRVHPLIGQLSSDMGPDRTVLATLGEIEKGHGQTLIIEFVVPSRSAGSYRIAQVEVEYDVPQTGLMQERGGVDILLTYAHDPAAVPPPNPQVMNLAEKVSAFKLQTRALEDLDAGNIPAATQKLKGALTHLLKQGDSDLAATVQQELAENLEKGRMMSEEGRKVIRFQSSKTVSLPDLPHAGRT